MNDRRRNSYLDNDQSSATKKHFITIYELLRNVSKYPSGQRSSIEVHNRKSDSFVSNVALNKVLRQWSAEASVVAPEALR